MIKKKDYVDRNTGGQVYSLHEVTTRVIFTMKICIFERSNEKKSFLEKLKYIFTKKLHHAYKDVLGYKT